MTDELKVLMAMKKAGRPLRPGDIAKLAGLSGEEATRAINVLEKDGRVVSP